jgi:hypothetical protein
LAPHPPVRISRLQKPIQYALAVRIECFLIGHQIVDAVGVGHQEALTSAYAADVLIAS